MITDVLFDVDGVFTDGKFGYTQDGKVSKTFGPHDSDGIKLLRWVGLNVSAISADQRGFEISRARMNDMKIPLTLVSEIDRFSYVRQNYDMNSLAFVGDGIFDAAVIESAKFGIAPANATMAAHRKADYSTKNPGGNGAVFEAAFVIAKKFFYDDYMRFMKARGLNEGDF